MGLLKDTWNAMTGRGTQAESSNTKYQAAVEDYLSENPKVAELLDKNNATLAPSSLPSKYDNTPYCTIVNGVMVHTLGEYKAECAKHQSWD